MSSYKHILIEVSYEVVILNKRRSYNAPGTRVPIDIEEKFSAANHCCFGIEKEHVNRGSGNLSLSYCYEQKRVYVVTNM